MFRINVLKQESLIAIEKSYYQKYYRRYITIYTQPQKKLCTFVIKISANLGKISLRPERFVIGKMYGCKEPKSLNLFIIKSYTRELDFNETKRVGNAHAQIKCP